MFFESFQALMTMDGHGSFVWSAYAISTVLLIGLFVANVQRRKRVLKQLRQRWRREC